MVDIVFDRTAQMLAYLWQFAALPFHSGRLAALRLAMHRATFSASSWVREDLEVLKQALKVIQQGEHELERTSLRFGASQELAALACKAFQARIRRQLAEAMTEDLRAIEELQGGATR